MLEKCYGNVRIFLMCTRYCLVDKIKEVYVDAVCSVRGSNQRCMQKLVGNPEDKMFLGRLTMLDVRLKDHITKDLTETRV
jgi:hypothetical protein